MDFKKISYWRGDDFRWVECFRCGLVLEAWAKPGTTVPPCRWSDKMVADALYLQRDADPGWFYTTGETVKTFCEQVRLKSEESPTISESLYITSFIVKAWPDQPVPGLPAVVAGLAPIIET